MHVAPLQPSDATRYRALMLEAYELAADAFTSTPQERAVETEAWWAKRITHIDSLVLRHGVLCVDEPGHDLVAAGGGRLRL